MADWVKVRWTQARQIAALIDPDASVDVPEDVTPADHVAQLRAADRLAEATTFLAVALPRFETIVWAMEVVERAPVARRGDATRTAISAWIDDPSDARRRAAWATHEQVMHGSAEQLLAHAVFLSGGSIAPVDLPVVNPNPDLCGRLAAAAVITAAHSGDDAAGVFARALDRGAMIAQGNAEEQGSAGNLVGQGAAG